MNETYVNEDERQGNGVGKTDVHLFLLHRLGYLRYGEFGIQAYPNDSGWTDVYRKERQKTKVEFIVPLHPIAKAIISHCRKEQERSEEQQTVKEKDDHLVFHRNCSRSVMDTKLSIVGKACGIRQRLSFHMARHTFGTMSLSAGIPIESIAKMMGHASISSTQIYAQVTDKKISEDMDRLIAKQSAMKRDIAEKEACEPSDISICKMEETA